MYACQYYNGKLKGGGHKIFYLDGKFQPPGHNCCQLPNNKHIGYACLCFGEQKNNVLYINFISSTYALCVLHFLFYFLNIEKHK